MNEPIRLGTLEEEPPRPEYGAMSGAEYLYKANERHKNGQMLTEAAECARLQGVIIDARPEKVMDANPLADAFCSFLAEQNSDQQLVYTQGEDPAVQEKTGPPSVEERQPDPNWRPGDPGYNGETPEEIYARADYAGTAGRDSEPDVIITDVHRLVQRQRMRPRPDDMQISCSAAMLIQQETGRYPTLEEHLEGTSPAYEIDQDEWGKWITRLYTPDESEAPIKLGELPPTQGFY